MELLELRIGLPLPIEELLEYRANWPDLVNPSSYHKNVVKVATATLQGLENNAPGYPAHIEDSSNRAAMVYHLDTYSQLAKKFPGVSTFVAGGFGENFIVNHPDLRPSVVCVGDVYQLGSAQFTVTGPRYPCPKVDAWHGTTGLQKYSLENGFAGYFLKVSQPGTIHEHDEFKLINRKNPGYTIQRISQGLFGPPEVTDKSLAFYNALIGMEDLLGKGFRNVAKARLQEQSQPDVNVKQPAADGLGFYASRLALVAAIGTVLSVGINAFSR